MLEFDAMRSSGNNLRRLVTRLIHRLAIVSLCTLSISPAFADTNESAPASNQDVSSSDTEFQIVLRKMHKLARDMRAAIQRAKRMQPEWNSTELTQELDKTMELLDSKHEFSYASIMSMNLLSLQMPLLDLRVVPYAIAMFKISEECNRKNNIFWVRSGDDFTGLADWLPVQHKKLGLVLAKAQKAGVPHTRNMMIVYKQSVYALKTGYTNHVCDLNWKLLKLAEESGDTTVLTSVVGWNNFFLETLRHRQCYKLHYANITYGDRERECAPADHELDQALDKIRNEENETLVTQIRALHRQIIDERRSSDRFGLGIMYRRLVRIANTCADSTAAVPYFALKAYHSFLETDYSEGKNYDELRHQLFCAWAAEELGKQEAVGKRNMAESSDRAKLERALTQLESQSVLVCREMEPCKLWGGSRTFDLFRAVGKNDLKVPVALVYYEIGKDDKLYLRCRSTAENWGNLQFPNIAVDNDRTHVTELVDDALRDAGCKFVKDDSATFLLRGKWKFNTSTRLNRVI